MNAKKAKMLRRALRDAARPEGTPEHRYLKHKKDGHIVVDQRSVRGAERRLKKEYARSPEVRAHIAATESYRKMLAAEKASGGPLFHKGGAHVEDDDRGRG